MATHDARYSMESGKAMKGKLYGVGLGPGDPELMTLKAYRLIKSADAIAYLRQTNGKSFARTIANDAIQDGVLEIPIIVPMLKEREPAQRAYKQGAIEISKLLDQNKNVVVLCEGDPFFYGSFMYLFSYLTNKYDVKVIPGVTSISACSSVIKNPLVSRNDILTILPAPLDVNRLKINIQTAETIAIIKIGRHLAKIRKLLDGLNLTQNATYIEYATLAFQKVIPLINAPESAPYFSMILVNKGNDPWL